MKNAQKPDVPIYECPECFVPRPSVEELAIHLRTRHAFPPWYAKREAGKAKLKLPHEVRP